MGEEGKDVTARSSLSVLSHFWLCHENNVGSEARGGANAKREWRDPEAVSLLPPSLSIIVQCVHAVRGRRNSSYETSREDEDGHTREGKMRIHRRKDGPADPPLFPFSWRRSD